MPNTCLLVSDFAQARKAIKKYIAKYMPYKQGYKFLKMESFYLQANPEEYNVNMVKTSRGSHQDS